MRLRRMKPAPISWDSAPLMEKSYLQPHQKMLKNWVILTPHPQSILPDSALIVSDDGNLYKLDPAGQYRMERLTPGRTNRLYIQPTNPT